MADVKISELPVATSVTAGDIVPIVIIDTLTTSSVTLSLLTAFAVQADDFGTAAFMDAMAIGGCMVADRNSTATISPDDHGKLLLSTSGTPTLTLPLAADVPVGWRIWVKARGTTTTLSRAGSDTVNGTTSVTISTGEAYMVVRSSSTSYEACR